MHSRRLLPLDEPLLGGNLEHRVELEAGGGKLLFGGPVVPLPLPLPARHHQEDEDPHQGNEGHPPDDGPDDERQFFGRRGLETAINISILHTTQGLHFVEC